jgi:hypothetical protein
MQNLVSGSGLRTGPSATIYEFLAKNDLIEGSFLRKGIRLIARLTEEFKTVHRLADALDETESPNYRDAANALRQLYKPRDKKLYIFIDDVDEYGFAFTRLDKLLVESLITTCMRLNTDYLQDDVQIRLIITPPTELYHAMKFWNRDKTDLKSYHLQWADSVKLHNIVNKRIAIETGVRRRNPRHEGDIFSIEATHTWDRHFPRMISNRNGRKEPSFRYLLRHTFYTPRNILALSECVLEMAETLGDKIEPSEPKHELLWNEVFQTAVEHFTVDLVESTVETFGMVYENLPLLLDAFRKRPAIWCHAALDRFLAGLYEEVNVRMKNSDSDNRTFRLIDVLYEIGFIGFASREPNQVGYKNIYRLDFRYLGRRARWEQWDLAVVSPVYFDTYQIRPPEGVTVDPDQELYLRHEALTRIMNYDHLRNA